MASSGIQAKTKKKLGGSYPARRRPNQGPHVPDASQFGGNGQAVVHFKAYGGGNALTLVKDDGSSQPAIGTAAPQYIQGSFGRVFLCYIRGWKLRDLCSPTLCLIIIILNFFVVTLPDGVFEGQTIHVQAPDGQLNAIVVPAGFGPGSTFTVEFAGAETAPTPAAPPPSTKETYSSSSSYATPVAAAAAAPAGGDDGFASGFNNPHYKPVPTANATSNFSDDYYSQYPTGKN